MSRMGPVRGRSISAFRMPEARSWPGVEVFVLQARQGAAAEAEAPPLGDIHPLVRRGPVEARRERRPPVDDQGKRPVVGVPDVATPEVIVLSRVQPQSSEEEGELVAIREVVQALGPQLRHGEGVVVIRTGITEAAIAPPLGVVLCELVNHVAFRPAHRRDRRPHPVVMVEFGKQLVVAHS